MGTRRFSLPPVAAAQAKCRLPVKLSSAEGLLRAALGVHRVVCSRRRGSRSLGAKPAESICSRGS